MSKNDAFSKEELEGDNNKLSSDEKNIFPKNSTLDKNMELKTIIDHFKLHYLVETKTFFALGQSYQTFFTHQPMIYPFFSL